MNDPLISVIIPTYERKEALCRLLDSLNRQTIPAQDFEVIVVDDGSNYPIQEIGISSFSYNFLFIRQSNQGATKARNNGAVQSKGEILVFIDDDVVLEEGALESLVRAVSQDTKVIALGALKACNENTNSTFTRIAVQVDNETVYRTIFSDEQVAFVACNTQLLAIRKEDFIQLGMFQDPTGGWPNWDDVDFGYRGHLAGYRFIKVAGAKGEHWDHALTSLDKAKQRWYRASHAAVRLFQRYPELRKHLPMYMDKTPIDWRNDPPGLISKKILRQIMSTRASLRIMELLVASCEKHFRNQRLLKALYRWINGGYMLLGYRRGLQDFGAVPEARELASGYDPVRLSDR